MISQTLRNQVAGLDTYWRKPGQAISRIAEMLHEHGLQIAHTISFDDSQPSARYTFLLQDESGRELDSLLVFAWYRLGETYEITAYLS